MLSVNFAESFAGTDPGGFNNSVAEQQVCSELLYMIYLIASKFLQAWGAIGGSTLGT